jgi:histone deacetylase 11
MNVAMVVEVPPVAILPNFVVQNKLLRPFRFQTAGTIMVSTPTTYIGLRFCFLQLVLQAGKLAMERGWAINIGRSVTFKGSILHCGP